MWNSGAKRLTSQASWIFINTAVRISSIRREPNYIMQVFSVFSFSSADRHTHPPTGDELTNRTQITTIWIQREKQQNWVFNKRQFSVLVVTSKIMTKLQWHESSVGGDMSTVKYARASVETIDHNYRFNIWPKPTWDVPWEDRPHTELRSHSHVINSRTVYCH